MVSVHELSPLVIILVVTAIALGLGGSIIASIQTGQTVNSSSWNASSNGLNGIQTMASWLPTIAIIVAAAVVIGILSMMFIGGRK